MPWLMSSDRPVEQQEPQRESNRSHLVRRDYLGLGKGSNPDRQRAPRPELNVDEEASGLTILLADDEAAIRNLAGQVLRSCGYTMLEAADGLEALETAERHPGPITCS